MINLLMQVVSGELIVKLSGATYWQSFITVDIFYIPGKGSFKLRVPVDTAYNVSMVSF